MAESNDEKNGQQILEQIRHVQQEMVLELRSVASKQTIGIGDEKLVMFGCASTEGYWRYLRQADWDLEEALQLMKSACDWHRQKGIQVAALRKELFSENPGLFSLRQIGHDLVGRPVLYHCFAQNSATFKDYTSDALIAHFQHVIENAGKSNREKFGVGKTCTVVLDMNGFDAELLKSKKLIVKVQQALVLLYPKTLEKILCVNYSLDDKALWAEVKSLFDADIAEKVKFIPPMTLMETLRKSFDMEVSEWLQAEVAANKISPLPNSQRTFYKACGTHDPRGCKAYIAEFLSDRRPDNYEPHSGIVYASH